MKLLAVEVIKPLLISAISGEGWNELMKNSVKMNRQNVFKCPQCDKTLNSSPGLKSHITKMHSKSQMKSDIGTTVTNDRDAGKVNTSDEHLLHENEIVIDQSNKINLDEHVDEIIHKKIVEKIYKHKCESCEYEVAANRKYVAIQMLLKHEELCCSKKLNKSIKINKCTECDFESKEEGKMRRHLRDDHGIYTGSTSPPPKKNKVHSNLKYDEEMETEDMNIDQKEENVEDISFKLEDMEIDTSDIEEEEADILKERSRMMDEKIKAKEKRNHEKESAIGKKLKEKQKKKKIETEKELTRKKKENKSLKI